MKLAVTLGGARSGRNDEAEANWVPAKAKERTDADYELIDHSLSRLVAASP
ncbi:hypothetical protein [Streptomyces sp. ME18-1-4]|uniref:hypothetical protein n=1 Tax=Streptomyces sp. ME18-1-4 TaxID=3028685 RepID=UPI0029BDA0B4|nr:hypothetical protein [Streptomyces sp. ME18-1-4]MDX3245125.1 hypothetical protein [Streptomyces sp. ME18-1-4]